MAPFSRFFSLGFAVAAPKNKAIRIRHQYNMLDDRQPFIYQDMISKRNGICYFQHSIVSLAASSDSDVLDNSLPVPALETPSSDVNLSHLCELLGATPTNLLSLKSNKDGVRGIYLNQNVTKDDILLSIPLDSCLRDDKPPSWFVETHVEDDCPAMQPSAWASRLAASLVDQQLRMSSPSPPPGMDIWLQLLPDSKLLRASLPIHWDENLLSSTRCTALELAIDSAYFSRADAVTDLTMALPKDVVDDTKKLCEDALDVVQTRSCRAETFDNRLIRLLAPIFDFINHASPANAAFALEGENLVVRALTDLSASHEILIDYGDATRPQWRCLLSYGFVSAYNEHDEDSNVAELYVQGKRFEVGPSTIPLALVEAIAAVHDAESGLQYQGSEIDQKTPETILTTEIAMRLANRLSEVAFQLLLEPSDPNEDLAQYYEDAINEDDKQEKNQEAPEDVVSSRLAASLRWTQHRTLLACASGLEDLARGRVTAKLRGEV